MHNNLTPPNALSLDGLNLPTGEKEEAYHFVVYLPIGDQVYELDGLKRCAVRHGKVEAAGWLGVAMSAIQRRIGLYPEGAVRPFLFIYSYLY